MFRSVTLELSLKPFYQTDDAFIEKVCRAMFEQWRHFIKDREIISVLLWTADGSEILDYTGREDDAFSWCCYVGTANKPLLDDGATETNLHQKKQFYRDEIPTMTYGVLKRIIATIKSVGKSMFPDATIRVGETFDIGPEFAVSDFKYNRHKEIAKGSGCDSLGFVDATALLSPDQHSYAAYPDGIPEGTFMGTFLGKQSAVFLKDMGFDYLWLSNGMGYCFEPWKKTGKIYDGERFYPERLQGTREKIFLFWKLFREACPDVPLETRGTNYSVGIDYATDGVPLYDIYRGGFGITPPPNSPWAAINGDFGCEIIGQLTRNALLPENDYMFRYYLHDPWWINSPWQDRYEGYPHDVYLPLALARIDEKGCVRSPSLFNILTVDTSFGEMPDACALEAIPHFLRAERELPDAPSPLVLLYPVREYTTAKADAEALSEMYRLDSYLIDAVNRGVPITTVVATDCFLEHAEAIYRGCVLIAPALLDNQDAEEKLARFTASGGKVIRIGSERYAPQTEKCGKTVLLSDSTDALFACLDEMGYSFRYETDDEKTRPTVTVHRHANGFYFSVYSRDTTVKSSFAFPLGAPILLGCDTAIENGAATYTFPRAAHHECRAFVKQKGGKVRAKELHSVNAKYRRKILLSGLSDAEVALFPETDFINGAAVGLALNDSAVELLPGFALKTDENGTYFHKEHVTGSICLLLPY